MSDYFAGRGPRSAESPSRLRIAALMAVIAGVVLLAGAAFVFSYSGIHHIALRFGVPATLARLYPLIFDAMLVIAGAAALALRGASWWARGYVWACLLVLLAAVAAGDALWAMRVSLPVKASRAAVAVTPWVLLLLAFGLWLAMLRHLRRVRATSPQHRRADARQAAAAEATGSGTTWMSGAGTGAVRRLPPPHTGLDILLEERHDGTPAVQPAEAPEAKPAAAPSGEPAAAAPSGEPAPAGDTPGGTPQAPDGGTAGAPADSPAGAPADGTPQAPAGGTAGAPGAPPPPSAHFDRMRSTPTPPEEE